MSEALEFWSEDRCFGLSLGRIRVRALLRFTRKARATETGGVLVGRYSEAFNCAEVTRVSPPPRDSKADRCSFERGSEGLEAWLLKLWSASARTYYLGEWHFHPYASAEASVW